MQLILSFHFCYILLLVTYAVSEMAILDIETFSVTLLSVYEQIQKTRKNGTRKKI